MKTICLIDGTGYIFRAYHAIRPMKNAQGTPIHAVMGFTRMLMKLIKEHKPNALGVVFDVSSDSFRKEIYPEYKANRTEPPEDLIPQFELCFESVDALGIPRIMVDGVEADDVLATLVRQAKSRGHKSIVVSGDKDLMQLVEDGMVQVLRYNARSETEELVDEQGVKDKFGVTPKQVIDVLALMGDSVDNVPGVDGVGEKTAQELIVQWGSVENVLDNAHSMKPGKRRDTLMAQRDRALLSKRLVTLKDDVPLPIDVDTIHFTGVNTVTGRAFLNRLGFKSMLNDPVFGDALPAPPTPAVIVQKPVVPSAQGSLFAAPVPPPPVITKSHYTTITRAEELTALVDNIRAAGRISVVTMADSEDAMRAQLHGIAVCWGAGNAAYVVVGADLTRPGISVDQVRSILGSALASPAVKVYAHDGKHHLKLLVEHGFPEFTVAGDPMLADYVLARGDRHDLSSLATRELATEVQTVEALRGKGKSTLSLAAIPVEHLTQFAAQRAEAALRIVFVLEERLKAEGMWELYAAMEMPLSAMLTRVEARGVLVRPAELHTLAATMRKECEVLEKEAHALAGMDFNLGSPKQLAEVLFEKLQLPVQRKTKTGPSTDVEVLETLSVMHPLPAKVLEHRQLTKLVGTYLEALPLLIHPRTGRIHTTYQQAVAATGRLSSQDPNLQNIPIRDERGRLIRRAFVAPPGRVLISADYSQIELRILAHVTEDPVLLTAFHNNEDVHTRTASEVFGIPLDKVTKDQRRDAKTINFGLLYGMSAFGLSQRLGIPRAQAQEYLTLYFQRLAGVAQWQQQTLEEARSKGAVTTMFGRRRFLPDLNDRNPNTRQGAERMAINTPIQGAAADIIKRAMITLEDRLRAQKLPAQIILQVHDELVVESDAPVAEEVAALTQEVMEGAASLKVRLAVERGMGADWAQAHG